MIRPSIVRAGTLSSTGRPVYPLKRLRAEEQARKKMRLSLQRSYLRESTTTKSHSRSLLTPYTSSRSHDECTGSHTGTKASHCYAEGVYGREIWPVHSTVVLLSTRPRATFAPRPLLISLREITFHRTARGSYASIWFYFSRSHTTFHGYPEPVYGLQTAPPWSCPQCGYHLSKSVRSGSWPDLGIDTAGSNFCHEAFQLAIFCDSDPWI